MLMLPLGAFERLYVICVYACVCEAQQQTQKSVKSIILDTFYKKHKV